MFNAVILFSVICYIIYIYKYFKYNRLKEMDKETLNILTISDFFITIKYILIFLSYAVYTNSFFVVYPFVIVVIFAVIINGSNFAELIKRTEKLNIW